MTEEQKARSAASKLAANEVLHNYAVLCLSDMTEMEAFRSMAASVGWKLDPSEPGPGYSLLNVMLLAAQRRPIVHCGGFEYWLSQGRVVAKGATSLATFRRVGSKNTSEEDGKQQPAEDGVQAVEKRKPRYYVKRGTFDVTQTVPREECSHCGTAPADPDDRTTECPPTCEVFALRPGIKPPLDLVTALMTDQLKDDEEGEGE
ncbi:hypothetical protein [Nonomuraea wenchangensis]|uniref:hypothetical protein n=1 Tax=Nonomuraea wenchangensis TaxID=568860 RepID=UPI00331A7F9F